MSLAADERKREFHEEKRQEFENYAEEERDGRSPRDSTSTAAGRRSADLQLLRVPAEQDERSRESIEQWREFHYDGLHPPQEHNRHSG